MVLHQWSQLWELSEGNCVRGSCRSKCQEYSLNSNGHYPLLELWVHFLGSSNYSPRLSDQADLTDSLEKSKLHHYRLTSEKVAMLRAGLRYSLLSESLSARWHQRQSTRVLHAWVAESKTTLGFPLAVGLRVRYCIKYVQNSVDYCRKHFRSCTCCSWKEWTFPWGHKASSVG